MYFLTACRRLTVVRKDEQMRWYTYSYGFLAWRCDECGRQGFRIVLVRRMIGSGGKADEPRGQRQMLRKQGRTLGVTPRCDLHITRIHVQKRSRAGPGTLVILDRSVELSDGPQGVFNIAKEPRTEL
jgi:hypothetical protein